ncbi:MAG: MFS transporter [Parvularculaceae bacterium]|nr:MFS transporter [Parvularculaceae bacterium]
MATVLGSIDTSALYGPDWRKAAALELRQEWKTALGACLGIGVGVAAYPIYIMPALLLHAEARFGWTRMETSSLSSAVMLGAAIGAPLAGWIVDRIGYKLPALISTLIVAGFLSIAASTNADSAAWRAGAFAMGLLGAASLSVTYSKAICGKFRVIRGVILGLAIGCASLFGLLAVPILELVIRSYNYPAALALMASSYLIVFIPALWLLLPKERNSRVNSRPLQAMPTDEIQSHAWGTLSMLATAGWIIAAAAAGGATQLAPLVKDSQTVSPALVSSILAFGVFAVRLLTGILLDQFDATKIAALAFGLGAIGLAMIGYFGVAVILPCAFLIALALGAEIDIFAYLCSRYVSQNKYGSYFGLVYSGMMLTSALSPAVMASIYIRTGSYALPFQIAAISAVTATILMLLMPSYKNMTPIKP